MDPRIPPDHAGITELVDREALDVHLSKVLRAQPFAILLAALAWLGFGPFIAPAWLLGAWFSAVVALAAWRYAQARRFRSSEGSTLGLRDWKTRCVAHSALSGLLWSSLALLVYPQAPLEYQPLALVVLMGVAGAGSLALAAIPPAAPLFLSVLLLPNAAMLLSRGTLRDQLAGWGMILTVIGLSAIARPLSRHLRDGMELRRRLEQALESSESDGAEAAASSESKRAFIATMSHAIRTSMNGIIGMTQLLERSRLDARQTKWLHTLQGSARHLRQLLDDILDLSRIEAGKVTLRHEVFDPREVVCTSCDLFRPSAHQKGVAIILHMADTIPDALRGDANSLRQILINLLGNAVDFTEAGYVTAHLTLLCPADGGPCVLDVSIQDSGPGVPADQQDAVFEPFSKVAGARSGNGHGTGLGLAISRRLATLMGGVLELDRNGLPGACFRLRVPMEIAEAAVLAPTRPSAVPTFADMKALVVEDSLSNQLVLQAALENLGLACDCVASGEAAIQKLERGHFDVVLMDCEMPGEDGYSTCRRWRSIEAREGRPRMPIAAVTANVGADDREAAKAAGMDGFLAKPFELDELSGLLAELTGSLAKAAT
ncbi:MAG: response regulator [Rhodocyclaceae bacterium]|nr:response regulator [Rhodocyclaceae bacterium]